MAIKVKTVNKISEKGLQLFDERYEVGENVENEDAILVRSAKLHDYDFPENLKAIARLVDGYTVEEIEKKLKGVECGQKGTSCGDQLARAVREAFEAQKK